MGFVKLLSVKSFYWLAAIPVAALFVTLDFGGKSQSSCVFCDPKILERQVLFEGNGVLAVYPYKPIVSGHVLILPKRHVERFEDLTQEEAGTLVTVIRKVQKVSEVRGEKDYLLLQKNGKISGQSVPHVHIHYMPRSEQVGYFRFLIRFLARHLFKPLDEKAMQERVAALREAFDLNKNS